MVGANKSKQKRHRSTGSALILTVVLTSLLAMVGVLFLLVSRLNRSATQATLDVQRLDSSVNQVLHRLQLELIQDVPGVADQEYHDGPDGFNPWLASLEPEVDGSGSLYWPQISNLTSTVGTTDQVRVALDDKSDPDVNDADYPWDALIAERDPIGDVNTSIAGLLPHLADADGDGIADAKWFVLDNSDPYKPILAAVRVVDHGGMFNVNTGYYFNQNRPILEDNVDGSNVGQINLLSLVDPCELTTGVTRLWQERIDEIGYPSITDIFTDFSNPDLPSLYHWQKNVVWNYTSIFPLGYAPFELSDELRLRFRYLLDYNRVHTRIEPLWPNVFEGGSRTPMMPKKYKKDARDYTIDPRWRDSTIGLLKHADYNFRHICTTVNGDRLIAPQRFHPDPPDPNVAPRMVDINRQVELISQENAAEQVLQERKQHLFNAFLKGIPNQALALQLAVNLVDFIDGDSLDEVNNVTVENDVDGNPFFGFERQPFIRKLKMRIDDENPETSSKNAFFVELYNPFKEEIPLNRVSLRLTQAGVNDPNEKTIPLRDENDWRVIPGKSSLVIVNTEIAQSALVDDANAVVVIEPDFLMAEYDPMAGGNATLMKYNDLALVRDVTHKDVTHKKVDYTLYLDYQESQAEDFEFAKVKAAAASPYYVWERGDVDTGEVMEPQWRKAGIFGQETEVAEGRDRNYNLADPNDILRVPTDHLNLGAAAVQERRFTRIGDILRVFTVGPGLTPERTVGRQLMDATEEFQYRVDLSAPEDGSARNPFANLFQYVTALDPNRFNVDLPTDEMRVKGRINVNTAPWFVLKALPWMDADLAEAIATNRSASGSFASIADLVRVPALRALADVNETRLYDEPNPDTRFYDYPDFTEDDAAGDLEKQHLLFSAISNLVTVRSDVFSAYILVRIGKDGPQRRVYALLDRSGVTDAKGKVEVLVRQNVPDPR